MRRRYMLNPKTLLDYTNYMTIETTGEGASIVMPRDVEYTTNGVEWKQAKANETVSFVGVWLVGFRSTLDPGEEFGTIKIFGSCNLRGNCLSLIYGDFANESFEIKNYSSVFRNLFLNCAAIREVEDSFLPATTLADKCYNRMFYGCTSLVNAPELPATILKGYCYSQMFSGCTSLVNAPELPATTLADNCYSQMFSGCTSLVNAPELPATTLADNCYNRMFYGCTSLVNAPELPATILKGYCYSQMFSGCTSLVNAPELPATTLADKCYNRMFYGCTSLVNAPELPATILKGYCYSQMFYGCTKLNYIKMLAIYIYANNCLNSWVYNVASTGTFVKNAAMTSLPTATSSNSYAGIPSGWTVQNA